MIISLRPLPLGEGSASETSAGEGNRVRPLFFLLAAPYRACIGSAHATLTRSLTLAALSQRERAGAGSGPRLHLGILTSTRWGTLSGLIRKDGVFVSDGVGVGKPPAC